jgi:hypothetical protein
MQPTTRPSMKPTPQPTIKPSRNPSRQPTPQPSGQPSGIHNTFDRLLNITDMNIQMMLKIVLFILTALCCNYHCDGLNAIIVISVYLCYDRCWSLSL